LRYPQSVIIPPSTMTPAFVHNILSVWRRSARNSNQPQGGNTPSGQSNGTRHRGKPTKTSAKPTNPQAKPANLRDIIPATVPSRTAPGNGIEPIQTALGAETEPNGTVSDGGTAPSTSEAGLSGTERSGVASNATTLATGARGGEREKLDAAGSSKWWCC